MPYKVEVSPFREARWAPKTPGFEFKYAWRILNDQGGLRASGVSNAPEPDVRRLATAAAQRMEAYATGVDAPVAKFAIRRGRKPKNVVQGRQDSEQETEMAEAV